MKNWVFGRRLMDEQPDNGGEGGGGGASPLGGEGETADKGGQKADDGADPLGGEGDKPNALGDELNKEGDQGDEGDKPKGDKSGASADKPTEDAPTEAEVQAYKDALKLDEATFGKDVKFDERYVEKLPALFKKHGLDPAKANALANDFAKMQKDVEKDTAAKVQKFREWRAGEMQKMNEAYYAEYDKAGREAIARAITHFFPRVIKDENGNEKINPMFETVCRTEVGVDKGFLKAMKFIGERLAKDTAPGAAAGAGTGGGKSLSDSFMGI